MEYITAIGCLSTKKPNTVFAQNIYNLLCLDIHYLNIYETFHIQLKNYYKSIFSEGELCKIKNENEIILLCFCQTNDKYLLKYKKKLTLNINDLIKTYNQINNIKIDEILCIVYCYDNKLLAFANNDIFFTTAGKVECENILDLRKFKQDIINLYDMIYI